MTKVPFVVPANSRRTLICVWKWREESTHKTLLTCPKSYSEGGTYKRCQAGAASMYCTWRRSRRWRSPLPPFCPGARAWEPGRAARATTRYSSSVTLSTGGPATCSSLPSLATSWSSSSKTDIANGTPVTPLISSRLPSTNSSPRSLSLLYWCMYTCILLEYQVLLAGGLSSISALPII